MRGYGDPWRRGRCRSTAAAVARPRVGGAVAGVWLRRLLAPGPGAGGCLRPSPVYRGRLPRRARCPSAVAAAARPRAGGCGRRRAVTAATRTGARCRRLLAAVAGPRGRMPPRARCPSVAAAVARPRAGRVTVAGLRLRRALAPGPGAGPYGCSRHGHGHGTGTVTGPATACHDGPRRPRPHHPAHISSAESNSPQPRGSTTFGLRSLSTPDAPAHACTRWCASPAHPKDLA